PRDLTPATRSRGQKTGARICRLADESVTFGGAPEGAGRGSGTDHGGKHGRLEQSRKMVFAAGGTGPLRPLRGHLPRERGRIATAALPRPPPFHGGGAERSEA